MAVEVQNVRWRPQNPEKLANTNLISSPTNVEQSLLLLLLFYCEKGVG